MAVTYYPRSKAVKQVEILFGSKTLPLHFGSAVFRLPLMRKVSKPQVLTEREITYLSDLCCFCGTGFSPSVCAQARSQLPRQREPENRKPCDPRQREPENCAAFINKLCPAVFHSGSLLFFATVFCPSPPAPLHSLSVFSSGKVTLQFPSSAGDAVVKSP